MIFFISDGRLGNQAFQYAFLNTIAESDEKVICINMTQFVECFYFGNRNFSFLGESKFANFFFKKVLLRVLELFVKLKMIRSIEQLKISGVPQPKLISTKGILSITFVRTGFFQSEHLFNKEKIDFAIKDKYLMKACDVLDEIPNPNKVFVHVRRGDYVYETYNGKKGFALPKQYYFDAMKEVEKSVTNPFYVFLTDDPDYVEDVFGHLSNIYISKDCMATDFAIMGLCQYGIGSNSSFSWWGSFFSIRKEIMIFPKYWYGWKTNFESHPTIQPSWASLIEPKRRVTD